MSDASPHRPRLLQQMERAMQLVGAAPSPSIPGDVSSRPVWPTPASASVLRAAASAHGRLGDMGRAVVCRDFADRFEVAADRGDGAAWPDFVRQCADWEAIDAAEFDFILDEEGGWRFAHTSDNEPIDGSFRPDASAAAAWAAPPFQLAIASASSSSSLELAPGPAGAAAPAPLVPSTEEIDSLMAALRGKPVIPMPLQR